MKSCYSQGFICFFSRLALYHEHLFQVNLNWMKCNYNYIDHCKLYHVEYVCASVSLDSFFSLEFSFIVFMFARQREFCMSQLGRCLDRGTCASAVCIGLKFHFILGIFLIAALLRFNSCTLQFSRLKCKIQWFLVCSQNCATVTQWTLEYFYHVGKKVVPSS